MDRKKAEDDFEKAKKELDKFKKLYSGGVVSP